jgi:hypothetical protein
VSALLALAALFQVDFVVFLLAIGSHLPNLMALAQIRETKNVFRVRMTVIGILILAALAF